LIPLIKAVLPSCGSKQKTNAQRQRIGNVTQTRSNKISDSTFSGAENKAELDANINAAEPLSELKGAGPAHMTVQYMRKI